MFIKGKSLVSEVFTSLNLAISFTFFVDNFSLLLSSTISKNVDAPAPSSMILCSSASMKNFFFGIGIKIIFY